MKVCPACKESVADGRFSPPRDLFMLVARGLLRSAWLAAGVYIAWWVTGNLFVFGHPAVAWLFLAVQSGLVIRLLTRFGLLAVIAYNVVNLLLVQFPMTSDLSAWYAGTGLFAMGLVVALAVYGFLTATGGVRNLLAAPVFSVNAGQLGAHL
jgi:hypothetical protein